MYKANARRALKGKLNFNGCNSEKGDNQVVNKHLYRISGSKMNILINPTVVPGALHALPSIVLFIHKYIDTCIDRNNLEVVIIKLSYMFPHAHRREKRFVHPSVNL